jgi:hypothetical protein
MALDRKKLLWIPSAMTRQRVALSKLLLLHSFYCLVGSRVCGRYAAPGFFVVQRHQRGLFHDHRRKASGLGHILGVTDSFEGNLCWRALSCFAGINRVRVAAASTLSTARLLPAGPGSPDCVYLLKRKP